MIDEEFEDDQRTAGGRRASDSPTVPLRDHLETLIRGVQVNIQVELADLAQKIETVSRRQHRVMNDVAALKLMEEHRRGGQDARTGMRTWVQWLPSFLAVLLAGYVAFFS